MRLVVDGRGDYSRSPRTVSKPCVAGCRAARRGSNARDESLLRLFFADAGPDALRTLGCAGTARTRHEPDVAQLRARRRHGPDPSSISSTGGDLTTARGDRMVRTKERRLTQQSGRTCPNHLASVLEVRVAPVRDREHSIPIAAALRRQRGGPRSPRRAVGATRTPSCFTSQIAGRQIRAARSARDRRGDLHRHSAIVGAVAAQQRRCRSAHPILECRRRVDRPWRPRSWDQGRCRSCSATTAVPRSRAPLFVSRRPTGENSGCQLPRYLAARSPHGSGHRPHAGSRLARSRVRALRRASDLVARLPRKGNVVRTFPLPP